MTVGNRLFFMAFFGLSACTEDVPELPELRLAQGGDWAVDPDAVCIASECELDEFVRITEVFMDGNAVDLISVEDESFMVWGRESGTSTVRVTGEDRYQATLAKDFRIIVRPIDEFAMSLQCDTDEPRTDPWLLQPEDEVYVEWDVLDSESRELVALPDFDLGLATLVEMDAVRRNGFLRMPSESTSFELASSLVEGAVATLRVYESDETTGFEASWADDEPLDLGGVKRIESALLVDEQRVCLDPEEREAEIDTPEICSFSEEELVVSVSEQGPAIRVFGRNEGLCVVAVRVLDGRFSARLEIAVIQSSLVPAGG